MGEKLRPNRLACFRSGLARLYRADEIDIGNPIEISIGSSQVTYTVCGFFNSVMMGSHNCAMAELRGAAGPQD